ncbi:MAG: hypothetical protein DRI46_11385 [Chloroflexi bacterium]|nr:MAG: hypothetical protein DRI46_11385 [Chloroflexota bacterium]
MAEKVEFPEGEPDSYGGDWPDYLEKNTEVHGVIVGFSDYRPTEVYTANNGTPYLKANLVFRVIDHEGLSGYHIRDSIQIPTDGERFLGTQQIRDILFHKLAPFGIKFTEVPMPTTPVDMTNMVMGKDEWEDTEGGMIGKLVTLVCGKPTKPYEAKKNGEPTGEMKGPFTTFGYFRDVNENVAELLKPDFDAWSKGYEKEQAAANTAASGGMDEDDDLPF